MNESKRTRSQYTTYTKWLNKHEVLTVTARYDDQCRNGYNSFSLTAELKDTHLRRDDDIVACGCMHEETAEHFPELKPFIKWHLTSSDGPMHYVANTMYHADDKDCWGLRNGEKRQILAGGKVPAWRGIVFDGEGNEIDLGSGYSIDSQEKPADNGDIKYVPWYKYKVGEGKTPDLDAARRCAIWPDASLEDLQDKEKLLARLPKLLEEFRADMESLGFIW